MVVIDSQSVKLGQQGGKEHGVNRNKFVKGRKRHIVVDALGLALGCYITAANVGDVKAAPRVLVWVLQMYERIVKVLAGKGYRGNLRKLVKHCFDEAERQVEIEISQQAEELKGLEVE